MQSSTSSCDYSSSSRTPERYQPHRHDSNCNNSTCSDDKGLVTAVEHKFTAKLRTDEHHLQYLHHNLHQPQMLTHRSGMAERAGTTTGDGEELNVEEFADNHKVEEEMVEVKSEGTVTEECSSSPCSSLVKRMDLEVGAACSREKPTALVGIVRGGRPSWVDSAWDPRCVTSHDNSSCVNERVVCERIFSEVLGDAVTGSPEESSDGAEDSWGRVLKEGVNKLPSSQYRGVVPQPNGRWGAQIYEKHQRVWLGTFNREEDAARAYDRAAVKFRGRDAMSNFRPVEESEAVFLRQHSKEQIVEMLRRHTYDDELEESKRLVSICMPATSPETPAVSMDLNRSNESNPTTSTSQPERSMEREYLFEKAVTPSDVGKLNRLVIPKQHAERCFPLDLALNAPCQILSFEDVVGKHWRFRYSYWNSSQSYVFTKGWSRFVKEKKLSADDIVSFQRGPNRELYIDFRRRVNNQVPQQVLPPPSMMHMISDSEIAGSSWVPGGACTKARGLNTTTMWHQLNLQNLYSFHKTKEQLFSQRVRTQQQQQLASFSNIQQQQLQEQLMHIESSSVSLPQRTRKGDVFSSQELRRCTDHEGGAAVEGRNFAANTVVVKQSQHHVLNHPSPAATTTALPVSSTAIGSASSGARGGTRLFGVDLERTSPSSVQKNILDRETSTVSSSNNEKSHAQQLQSLNTRDASSTMYQRESGFQDMRTNCKRIMQHGRSTTPVMLGTELQEQSPFMIMGLSFVKCRGVEHESASRIAVATNNSDLQLMSSISVDDQGSIGGASSARSELLQERKPSTAASAAAGGPVVVVSVSMAAGDHSRKRKVDILESLRNSKSKYTLADSYERYNGAPNTSLSLAQNSEPMT